MAEKKASAKKDDALAIAMKTLSELASGKKMKRYRPDDDEEDRSLRRRLEEPFGAQPPATPTVAEPTSEAPAVVQHLPETGVQSSTAASSQKPAASAQLPIDDDDL